MGSAVASGMQINRVDRIIADAEEGEPPLAVSTGERRGKRYALTKAGVKYVESMLQQAFRQRMLDKSKGPEG